MSPVPNTTPTGRRRAASTLRRLGPEPWGRRLARARETRPGGPLTQDDAAAWLAAVTLRSMTGTTISRLESRDELPGGRKAGPVRRNAYLLTVLYELDPSELDLTDDDGPGELAVARLRKELSATLDTAPVTIGYPAPIGGLEPASFVAAGHARRPGTPDTAPVIPFLTELSGLPCVA